MKKTGAAGKYQIEWGTILLSLNLPLQTSIEQWRLSDESRVPAPCK